MGLSGYSRHHKCCHYLGDLTAIKNPSTELNQAYGRLFAPRTPRDMRSILAVILPLQILQALPLKRNELIKTENGIIRYFRLRSIEKTKDLLLNPEATPGVNILSVALRSQNFENDDPVGQLMTFLVAGHETTGLFFFVKTKTTETYCG